MPPILAGLNGARHAKRSMRRGADSERIASSLRRVASQSPRAQASRSPTGRLRRALRFARLDGAFPSDGEARRNALSGAQAPTEASPPCSLPPRSAVVAFLFLTERSVSSTPDRRGLSAVQGLGGPGLRCSGSCPIATRRPAWLAGGFVLRMFWVWSTASDVFLEGRRSPISTGAMFSSSRCDSEGEDFENWEGGFLGFSRFNAEGEPANCFLRQASGVFFLDSFNPPPKDGLGV